MPEFFDLPHRPFAAAVTASVDAYPSNPRPSLWLDFFWVPDRAALARIWAGERRAHTVDSLIMLHRPAVRALLERAALRASVL